MKMQINTAEFVNGHGKTPKGYGNWAFWLGCDTSDINKAYFFTGTFTEAKKQAVAKARELGISTITVGA